MSQPLELLELLLEPTTGPLLPQVREALAKRLGPNAEALRWAITAVQPPATAASPSRLSIEAVVWRPPQR